ncbi:MAG: creatininase family protein [Vicinamibacterales bacterium]
MTRKHLLAELTWYEARERLSAQPVVLLPFGSQEEQGPHAPMGDYLIAERIAADVARRADALAAPVVPFGYADYFRPFPGAISLRPETFSLLCEDMCIALLDRGIERLVVLNGHSGNYPLVDHVVRKLKAARGVLIPCINLWRIVPASLMQELYGDRAADAPGHGADPLTSVYLHLFPEHMRLDLIEHRPRKQALGLPIAGFSGVRFQGAEVHLPLDGDEICDTGIVGGDPTLASADKGRRIYEFVVDYCAAFVAHFATVSPRVGTR